MLLLLTQRICVGEIVAATAESMRDPTEYARRMESTLMEGFAEKVVTRAEKFKSGR